MYKVRLKFAGIPLTQANSGRLMAPSGEGGVRQIERCRQCLTSSSASCPLGAVRGGGRGRRGAAVAGRSAMARQNQKQRVDGCDVSNGSTEGM